MVSPVLFVQEHLAPSAVLPFRENFTNILGRRARASALSGAQKRAVLLRGAEYLAALRKGWRSDPRTTVRALDRDAAAQAHPTKRARTD